MQGVILTPCNRGGYAAPAHYGGIRRRYGLYGNGCTMSAGQSEADDVATLVELHVILLADFDAVDGVITGVEGQRQRCLSLHVPGLAEIVYLIEVVGIAGFLCDALQMGLAVNLDSHVDIPSFVNLQHAAQPLPICNIIVNQQI